MFIQQTREEKKLIIHRFHATGDDSHLGSRVRRPSMSLTPSGESVKTDFAELVSQVSRIGTTTVTSTYSMRETVSEKWEKLLKIVSDKAETDRNKMMDVEVKKSAIKESFLNNLDKFVSCVDWYVNIFFLFHYLSVVYLSIYTTTCHHILMD